MADAPSCRLPGEATWINLQDSVVAALLHRAC